MHSRFVVTVGFSAVRSLPVIGLVVVVFGPCHYPLCLGPAGSGPAFGPSDPADSDLAGSAAVAAGLVDLSVADLFVADLFVVAAGPDFVGSAVFAADLVCFVCLFSA